MKKFFDYFIPTIIGLMFVILICCLKNVFKLETSKEVFHVLVDAFFAVGCVIFCLGAIAYSANKGAFTMLGYSMKRFISLFSNFPNPFIFRLFIFKLSPLILNCLQTNLYSIFYFFICIIIFFLHF